MVGETVRHNVGYRRYKLESSGRDQLVTFEACGLYVKDGSQQKGEIMNSITEIATCLLGPVGPKLS